MHKKLRGLTRTCALAFAVLAVSAFSACAGDNADAAKEASTASSSIAGMAEKVAPSITARIEFLLDDAQQHPGSVSEQQQDILRRALDHDGVIPRGDYDAAWSRYQDCMAAKGYAKPVTGVFTDGLRSNVMHPYMEGWTKAQQSKFFEDDNSCKQLEYLYVDEIYRANLGNPNQYTDMDTAVVDCLRRKNLVDNQYTLTQFKLQGRHLTHLEPTEHTNPINHNTGTRCAKLLLRTPCSYYNPLLRQGELRVVDVGVETAAREQLVVCAAFHDVAVLHDEDHVGVANRGEAVRDADSSSTVSYPLGSDMM